MSCGCLFCLVSFRGNPTTSSLRRFQRGSLLFGRSTFSELLCVGFKTVAMVFDWLLPSGLRRGVYVSNKHESQLLPLFGHGIMSLAIFSNCSRQFSVQVSSSSSYSVLSFRPAVRLVLSMVSESSGSLRLSMCVSPCSSNFPFGVLGTQWQHGLDRAHHLSVGTSTTRKHGILTDLPMEKMLSQYSKEILMKYQRNPIILGRRILSEISDEILTKLRLPNFFWENPDKLLRNTYIC